MKNSYSRKELQGWGDVKHTIRKSEISFINHEVDENVRKEYQNKVEALTDKIVSGLGFPKKDKLDMKHEQHQLAADMYQDLLEAGLKYLSFEKDNSKK